MRRGARRADLGALGEASDESSDALGLVVEEVTDRGVELTLEIRLQICVLLRLRQLGLAMLSKGRGHDAVNSLLELFVGGFEGCDEVLARLELLEVPVEMGLELLPHLGHLRVGGAVLPLHQVKVPRHAVKLELDPNQKIEHRSQCDSRVTDTQSHSLIALTCQTD